jgi:hypothetical protein
MTGSIITPLFEPVGRRDSEAACAMLGIVNLNRERLPHQKTQQGDGDKPMTPSLFPPVFYMQRAAGG